MSKILVTTDFSANSKTGIRFAIQLASQSDYELVFYNAVTLLRPTSWSPERYKRFVASEIDRHQNQLEKFISEVFQKSNLPPVRYQCVAEVGIGFASQVISYAKKMETDFICVSTKGAGNIEKLFGTNSSALIETSTIPVFVIPHTYRVKPVINIWYASDLQNLSEELKTVDQFAEQLNAKIQVLHYDYLVHSEETKNKFEEIHAQYQTKNISFLFKKLNIEYSLIHHLQNDIEKSKPSLLVLFTKQNRNWFDRLLLSSDAAELTFDTKTPLLVFRKTDG